MIVEIAREAELDAERAAGWYAEQMPHRLGAFLAAYVAAVRRAGDMPAGGVVTTISRAVRRYPFDGFPFALIAVFLETRLVIVAVAHNRRSAYWKKRVRTLQRTR